jgi:hypothetical protein
VRSHPQIALLTIIKRSLGALRLAVADAQTEPTRQLVARVVEEAETLSAATKSFSKRVDLSAFNIAPPPTDKMLDIDQQAMWCSMLEDLLRHGPCCICGGVLNSSEIE